MLCQIELGRSLSRVKLWAALCGLALPLIFSLLPEWRLMASAERLVSLSLSINNLTAQQPASPPGQSKDGADTQSLELGQAVERELAGGQMHSYRIALEAGQFLHVVIEQRGIDVVVTLFGPDGKKLAEVDSPNGAQGPEPVFLVVEAAGNYRLEVQSLEKEANPGRYEVNVVALHNATPRDHSKAAAEKALAKARQLRAQGAGESLRNAIKEYETARLQFQELGDRSSEATVLNSIGMIYDVFRQPQKSLEYYRPALALRQALGDRNLEAETLSNIGSAYSELRDFDQALDHLHRALEIKREFKDLPKQAATLNNIGGVHQAKGEPEKALESYNQALPIWLQIEDRKGEAKTRGNMAIVYRRLGENQKARDYFTQALNLSREAKDRQSENVARAYLGDIFTWLGDTPQALEHYDQAIAYFRDLGDRRTEANLLNATSTVYREAGAWQKALENINQALKIMREIRQPQGEALMLNNLGSTYHTINENQKALDHYQEALRIRREIKDRDGEAETLSNIGVLYRDLGESERAISYYLQALPLFRTGKFRRGEANLLNNLGVAYRDLPNYQKALEQYELALQIWRGIGDRAGEGLTLQNMGIIYRIDLGDTPKAIECYEKALALARAVNDRDREAAALDKIGWAYLTLREPEKALDYLNQALALYRSLKDRRGEAETLHSLARVERERGNLNQARVHLEAALEISESMRVKIVSQELRASYSSFIYNFYADYVDLLMQLHKRQPAEGLARSAWQANERTRARSLLESLREPRIDLRRGISPALLAEEQRLQQQLNAKAQALLRSGKNPRATEQTEALQREYDLLAAELQQLQAQIKQKSPGYASLTQTQSPDIAEIQKSLGADTLLLQYALCEERSYLWVVTSTTINDYDLPKRAEIEAAAKRVRELLTESNRCVPGETEAQNAARMAKAEAQYVETAAQLSQMLLGPVAAQLGAKRLLIVADGALQYVPFSALPVPNAAGPQATRSGAWQPLLVNHEIVNLPSASTITVLRRELKDRQLAPKAIAVLGDPIFDINDERFDSSVAQVQNRRTRDSKRSGSCEQGRPDQPLWRRLSWSGPEVNKIAKLAPADQVLVALGFRASRAAAMSEELSQYRIVHFSTHGKADSERPELSTLVFSLFDERKVEQDGYLRAHEIYNLNLPAELVVLSACETGLGKQVRGEGIVGLTRGFMHAGAKRVVVSLWNVNDAATSDLMGHFYRKMLKEGMPPAKALRAAQIEMWKRKGTADPFYWAAFVLQGEWR